MCIMKHNNFYGIPKFATIRESAMSETRRSLVGDRWTVRYHHIHIYIPISGFMGMVRQ
jgi:hypothetical protein